MTTIDIRIDGLDEVRRVLDPDRLLAAVQRGIQSALSQLAPILYHRIRNNAPVRTGRLRRNIRVEVVEVPGGGGLGIALIFYGWPVNARTGFVDRSLQSIITDGTLARVVSFHVNQALTEALS